MLSKKYKQKFSGEPAIGEAYDKAKNGKVLVAGAHWYWIGENGKEAIKSSDFDFLTLDEKGEPWESFVSCEGGKWDSKTNNVTGDLGRMDDLLAEIEKVEEKLLDDKRVLEIIDNNPKLKTLRKKTPHLRLSKLQFSLFDVDLEKPTWRVEMKNWPLISYLKKKEESKTVEVVLDAMNGKLISYKESKESRM